MGLDVKLVFVQVRHIPILTFVENFDLKFVVKKWNENHQLPTTKAWGPFINTKTQSSNKIWARYNLLVNKKVFFK